MVGCKTSNNSKRKLSSISKQKTIMPKSDTKSDTTSVKKPVAPKENTKPKKAADKKDMYLVPDSAVKKIK